VICAAPSYLQRHGVPRSLNDLEAHRCSVFRHSEDGRIIPWRVKVGDGEQDHPVHPAFCTNDEQLELHAVLAGVLVRITFLPIRRASSACPRVLLILWEPV